ncbi:MAG: DUF3078 domain-containing protein [candidate division KSB1 bacterium]|nr:DUF3078 domain-containing protein [candidate division KSB1 bacterium]
MHRFILPILMIFCVTRFAFAQDSNLAWEKAGNLSLNLTRSQFDNYVQGGEDAFAWQTGLSFQFTKKNKLYNLSHSGKLGYGKSKIGDQGARKTVDEIKLESVYTQQLTSIVNPFISATGETQFAAGYDYSNGKTERSNFFDPAFFRESIGLNYNPSDLFKARLGFSSKQTITSDHAKPFADDRATSKIEKTRIEYGLESVIDLKKKMTKTSKIVSKLEIFSNLHRIDETDVRWDMEITAEFTQYIDFTMNMQLLYDKTISSKRQIKEMIGVGLSYNLF